LRKYSNEVKKKKRETKIIILTKSTKNQISLFKLGADDVLVNHIDSPELIAARVLSTYA